MTLVGEGRAHVAGPSQAGPERLRLALEGTVQGVGFRPFVYRLARELRLGGWVANDPRGVVIEVEGESAALERFVARLRTEHPAPASIVALHRARRTPCGERGFGIRASQGRGARTTQLPADLATCAHCRSELADPTSRRAGYAFTNCTACGPRFSIIHALPYDRAGTTMAGFELCRACRREYADPADRRFHAEPNACPVCGPELALWTAGGRALATGGAALDGAAEALRRGEIVGVKGLGGFHLLLDARNGDALRRLRRQKPRREKPLALMAQDLAQVERLCRLDDTARAALASPEAPILLLPRRDDAPVHPDVAPDNPYLGVMLPCTPLHHLLLARTGRPLVATSGNRSDEPICTDEREARRRLAGLADRFLVHDRPIARHVDDSVAWIVRGETRLLRRARGYAPRPLVLAEELPVVLAVGAHLKSAVALSIGRQVFVSQHIGDLETPEAVTAFERVIADFLRLYAVTPAIVAHDLHPDYVSTRWAREAVRENGPLGRAASDGSPPRLVGVQHHHAHLAACLAENGVAGPALGVTWDGLGYGSDGTLWGGEFLLGTAARCERVGHLRALRLPGAERAMREPRRAALGALFELYGERALAADDLEPVRAFRRDERALLGRMLERGLRAPFTTSAGRLFDAVAALAGPWQRTSFEGQAAMGLEYAADRAVTEAYPVAFGAARAEGGREPPEGAARGPLVVDWLPLLESVIDDVRRGVPLGVIAGRFHNALADAILHVARHVGEPRVALSGGCFQNRLLLERTVERLEEAGFRALLHRQVPPNDGGLGLGQVAVAAAREWTAAGRAERMPEGSAPGAEGTARCVSVYRAKS